MKRALISVYDKRGISEFAKKLVEFGYEIISSGGTARHLKGQGIPVILGSEITKSPEMLGGRVKTLHPYIFGGILAREQDAKELKKHDIQFIDIVVCNLYPFEDVTKKSNTTLADAIENIDIGGVSLLRAAAKNFERVTVVFDREDYQWVLEKMNQNGLDNDERISLARKTFIYTCKYDSAIAQYLSQYVEKDEELPSNFCIPITKISTLRYGENPHQSAGMYRELNTDITLPFKKYQGKELSYINIIDMESALTIANSFDETTSVIVKHTNPCGVGIGNNTQEAYERALSTDPMSAFGGIIGFNRTVTGITASIITKSFKEVVIAPSFDKEALEIFKKKKNLRIIEVKTSTDNHLDCRTFFGGWLIQEKDKHVVIEEEWECVSKKKPTEKELAALRFAWKVVGFVKSNAIVITEETRTLGIGAGQMSRIDAAELAVKKAKQTGLDVKGGVLASDALFPFRDSIDFAAKEGITAVIEPGGSKRDQEVIDAADEHNIALIFTHRRHFRH